MGDLSFRHLSASNTQLVEQLQFAPKLLASDFTTQQLAVFGNRLADLSGSLVQEFDSKILHAQLKQARHILGAGLRQGIKNGIPATNVSLDRMFGACAIAELEVIFVAGAAAIGKIRALGKE